jgi:PIN domain nuclease of toxin-antitoxin system
MKYVVDTHALIWFLEGNPRLGANAKTILSHPDSRLVIPATTLAEAVWIVEKGKTSISSAQDLLAAVEADSRVIIYPLDRDMIEITINLSAINEMHDRQIVATVIFLANKGDAVQLLSCDKNIVESGLVRIAW